MSAHHRGESEPLFFYGELPVRLISILVALHCAAMVAVTVLLASGHGVWLDALSYNSTAVAEGQLWRLVTYAFVAAPSIWFLFEMLMLWYFGREVENGLGWRRFAILYAGLVLIGPMLLQGVGYAGFPQRTVGAQEVNFAIFAAFVAMHPGAQFFFGVAARWVFVGLMAISSLQLLADHQTARVLVLLASSLLAIVLMRRAGFEEPIFGVQLPFRWSLPGWRGPKPRFSVLPGALSHPTNEDRPVSRVPASRATVDPDQEMDRLLEKISRTGISSLSSSEREALEEARQAILQRGVGGSR